MSDHIEQCNRCGRVLKSEKSKKVGYGPVCLRKQEAEKAEAEAGQQSEARHGSDPMTGDQW